MAILNGQTALVTGADSGIGAGVARALAASGASVGIAFHGNEDKARQLVTEIENDGGRALAIKVNVADEDEVLRMFENFLGQFERLDILVANAGMQDDAPVTEMTAAQWQRVLGVNLTGAFYCARSAIAQFMKQGIAPVSRAKGKIICMSSVHQRIPWAGHVNYAASKGGMMLMMQTMAQEVASAGIRINAIAPGAIKTPINQSEWQDPEKAKNLLKLIPYGRIGDPDDVAKAAVWLASDDSDYVTGTTLFVDGGMSLYPGFRGHG